MVLQAVIMDITYSKRYGRRRREKHCYAAGRHVAERILCRGPEEQRNHRTQYQVAS